MQKKSISELEREYELELDRVIRTIKKELSLKKKLRKENLKVLLQFPDGLKPYSTVIADEIEKKTKGKVECLIWFGTCFGACDVPIQAEKLGVDLIIQFGHSAWNYKRKDIKVL